VRSPLATKGRGSIGKSKRNLNTLGKTQDRVETFSSCHSDSQHPDHSSMRPRLSKIRGQIDGIERMIQERRYCVDILIQFRAAMAALRTAELLVFETHLHHCVRSAMRSNDEKNIETKIHELTELLARHSVI
jgi:DNA-binding FrmR family transcriptional regulator